jgi:hypothetical protein
MPCGARQPGPLHEGVGLKWGQHHHTEGWTTVELYGRIIRTWMPWSGILNNSMGCLHPFCRKSSISNTQPQRSPSLHCNLSPSGHAPSGNCMLCRYLTLQIPWQHASSGHAKSIISQKERQNIMIHQVGSIASVGSYTHSLCNKQSH